MCRVLGVEGEVWPLGEVWGEGHQWTGASGESRNQRRSRGRAGQGVGQRSFWTAPRRCEA